MPRTSWIYAPTGAGKTEIASCLLDFSVVKNKRCTFVMDRVSLIDQTSRVFYRHGIDHGVQQADHPLWRPDLPVQVCSIQTLEKRGWPEAQLNVVDEAHSMRKSLTEKLAARTCISLGLTATPFAKGLGKLYDRIVNVATTNQLIADGFLVPYRIFACAEPDMSGVKVVKGEFEAKETEKRALEVVGDVVQEYLKHGEGRKFICSAVDTAHVAGAAAPVFGRWHQCRHIHLQGSRRGPLRHAGGVSQAGVHHPRPDHGHGCVEGFRLQGHRLR